MLLEAYTPREHLLFQSTLRMPRDVTKAQREQRVDACIKMFLGPVEAMGWKVEIPTCLNSRHWTRAKLVEWFGYGSIPIDTFLVGWTSIYQLFLGFTRYQGFDPSPTGGMISDSEICSFASCRFGDKTEARLGVAQLQGSSGALDFEGSSCRLWHGKQQSQDDSIFHRSFHHMVRWNIFHHIFVRWMA